MMPTDQPSVSTHTPHVHFPSINITVRQWFSRRGGPCGRPLCHNLRTSYGQTGDHKGRPYSISVVGATLVVAPERRRERWGRILPASGERLATTYAVLMPSCIKGIERNRLPVAAKIALSTAGAATDTVGSPTPPQKLPDGITMTSTTGISRMRSEL